MPCASFRQGLYPQLFTEGDLTLNTARPPNVDAGALSRADPASQAVDDPSHGVDIVPWEHERMCSAGSQILPHLEGSLVPCLAPGIRTGASACGSNSAGTAIPTATSFTTPTIAASSLPTATASWRRV